MKCYRKYIQTNKVFELTYWKPEEFEKVIDQWNSNPNEIGIWIYYIK
jgi:hypothetical protein